MILILRMYRRDHTQVLVYSRVYCTVTVYGILYIYWYTVYGILTVSSLLFLPEGHCLSSADPCSFIYI